LLQPDSALVRSSCTRSLVICRSPAVVVPNGAVLVQLSEFAVKLQQQSLLPLLCFCAVGSVMVRGGGAR